MDLSSLDTLPPALESAATFQNLVTGQVLFHQREPAPAIFAVTVDRLRLVRYTSEGQLVIFQVVRAGKSFSESALFSEHYNCCLKLYLMYFTTLEKLTGNVRRRSFANAVAIKDGRFLVVGAQAEVMATKGKNTQVIHLRKRTVIPGLNDSYTHLIRGGLNYNLELRWDGVPSLGKSI